ncbi:MAG: M12 family metallopeptidase, partial [Chitinophagaceae bacterium]
IQPLSGETAKMWRAGDTITVGFFSDGDEFVTSKVKHFVKEWETFANITFLFVTDVATAKIRVGFAMDGTSWSFVGREALVITRGSKSMNFGWFDTSTENAEFSRVILHEFGHALGFIHEHQHPNASIPWDKDKVYAYYKGPPNNWDSAYIKANIFDKYSKTITNSSAYDPLSIMHYDIPAEFTTDGSSVGLNTSLSPTDKTFARQVYPFPYIPPTVSGVLKTGDDCDEIEFTVEYNAVHRTEVEFILQPGYDHHNALVNWWKMIGIPQKGNPGMIELGLNTTKRIDANMIDSTRAITFGKAKVLGVHTGLGYTWSPWPAIIGGCRIKFVWRRDSCN